ncbi:MAG TPA: bifunctional DNA-formamidopyrimidine glycosylase/DNA-(apurinic or apyrimidinic site) lyase [Casimicrobiaceae bacterium]|nr:bifunctional DNA-formamidopyrimidine glycosylase/DNA-(apurinic or apyrimidinic site) lyase [Casimicrobiaceae bacterium]
MPELPEVETTRRGIAAHASGRRIDSVQVYDGRLRWPVPDDLPTRISGRTIRAINRRSKYLLFKLDDATLLVHLGMTGSFRVITRATDRRKHDHVDILLEDGSRLRYHDPRRFGAMLIVDGEPSQHPLLAGLGPEPLSDAFDPEYLYRRTRGRTAAIKVTLMDSRLVVGVGNIYANEALFRAGIRPTTPSGRLSRPKLARLVGSVREVLTEAIESGGSTLRDYVDPEGAAGRFQLIHRVYGRAGLPCRVCGTTIRASRLGQRASFHCPHCQPR